MKKDEQIIFKPMRAKRTGVALLLKNFSVKAKNKILVNKINLRLLPGQVHFLVGPNGAGKSTLLQTLAQNNPDLKISQTQAKLFGQNFLALLPNKRVREGLWLAHQNPLDIPGLPLIVLARTAYEEIFGYKNTPKLLPFRAYLESLARGLNLNPEILSQPFNEKTSGGEKKKVELLFLQLFQPALALIDEIDSGLDIDSLKLVAQTVNLLKKQKAAILLVTHSFRLAHFLKPDRVHIMTAGQIVQNGPATILKKLEKTGFKKL